MRTSFPKERPKWRISEQEGRRIGGFRERVYLPDADASFGALFRNGVDAP